jgi:hypothetical protein
MTLMIRKTGLRLWGNKLKYFFKIIIKIMPLKGSMQTVKIVLIVVLSVGIVGLAAYKIYTDPTIFQSVKNKLTTTISPARDLRGTWISALSGKGFQLNGQFSIQGTTTTIYEDGDIELIINDVKDNIAYGTMRYTNICAWGFSIVPNVGQVTVPKTCNSDTGTYPIQIRVSSSALDFGTVNVSGVTTTMKGSYTTDFIHGTMTATVEPYGTVNGLFNLNRQR